MSQQHLFRPFIVVLGWLALGWTGFAEIEPAPKAVNDESQYRRFVLDNGMKVILLSDPKLNKSSASISIGVGSLSDPRERQGLAHFLEHMLFLGTEKYPSESDYGNYLRSNGGYSNAYTAGDHTNYHFEIRHEAFEGAIDRLAQFFIAPLFTPEFSDREMNAVNSENQKNLENDGWRGYQLRNSLYAEGHPENHFSTGNLETLTGTTREELLAFHEKYYSANRMTLALTGKAGLDQLEAWVREYFTSVKNNDTPEVRYPDGYLPEKAALRMARMVPVKDLREIAMEFSLPGMREYWDSKPGELIGFILGYEGEGSLLSKLKAEGLATSLGAGVYDRTVDYSSFNVNIGLTPAGLENHMRVLELFFAAVNVLTDSAYPSYLFKERAAVARLDEMFKDKGEGANRATTLANLLRDYPLEIAEREPYLWVREDPHAYNMVLEHLRPDNMLVTLVSKGLETDSVEPIYGTEYAYSEEAGDAYDRLTRVGKVDGIHLPNPNPFIPTSTDMLALEPVRLINEPALSLYYAQDVEFLRPMVAQIFRLRLPRDMASLETSVLLGFYQQCVSEALNEIAYTAGVAGLQFSLSAELEGVTVVIQGYDDAAPRLLDAVMENLKEINISEERFDAIKDRMIRGLDSFRLSDAWRILLERRRSLIREFHYRPDEQLPVAKKVTFDDVKAFARTLYSRGKIESLVHGNVSAGDAIASARRVQEVLATEPVDDDELLRRRLLVQAQGDSLLTSEKLEVNNSAFRQEYVLGDDDPEIRAATMALSNFISEPYYSEMRTHQQLGYIVFGGAGEEEWTNFAYFIIQSGDYAADELSDRSRTLVFELPEMLRELPDEAWKMIMDGVRAELEEKDKTIAERAGRLFELAYDRDGDWSRRKDTLAALETLSKVQVADLLAAALDPETQRSRTFLGFSRDHEATSDVPSSLDNDARSPWKSRQAFK